MFARPENINENLEKKLKVFRSFVLRNRTAPNPFNWRVILYTLARLEFYTFNRQQEALSRIEESIHFNPNIFDLTSYYFLKDISEKKMVDDKYVVQVEELLKKLTMMPFYPGEKKLMEITKYIVLSVRTSSELGGISPLELAELCQKIIPIHTASALELSSYNIQRGQLSESSKILLEAIRANPFSNRTRISDHIFQLTTEQNIDLASREQAREFVAEFNSRFPAETYLFSGSHKRDLYDWILWDFNRIADKFNSKKIPLVFQNYHWIRFSQYDSILYRASEDVAKQRKMPFIDTHSVFQSTALKSLDEASYFTQKFGSEDSHPSEKGHKLIAYIVYKNLVDQKLLPDEINHFNADEILK